jgi:hypothetical protein
MLTGIPSIVSFISPMIKGYINMPLSFDTTVKNGLPVTVCFEVGQPEHDVGIFTHYVEDIWLETKGKRARWLEDRLTTREWVDLEKEAIEEFHDSQ